MRSVELGTLAAAGRFKDIERLLDEMGWEQWGEKAVTAMLSELIADAAYEGRHRTVSSLLAKAREKGVSENLSLSAALSNACHHGSLSTVRLLLKASADPGGKSPRTPWIELHSRTALKDDDKIAALLIAAGLKDVDIKKTDGDGWTALARAAYCLNPGGVKRNLTYFDVNAEGDLGTPLFSLLFRCSSYISKESFHECEAGECVQLLLAAGANGEAALKTFLSLMRNNDREVPDACQNLVALIEQKSIGGSTGEGKKEGKGGPWI